MSELYPTSPNLPVERDIVRTAKEFSGAMTLDLTDDEIKRAIETTVSVHNKHRNIWIAKMPFDNLEQVAELLEEFEKELSYRMMEEVDCLVRVDGVPVLQGEAPVIEWLGKVEGTSLAKYGQDHEKKEYQVKQAAKRDENYLGEKDNYESR